MTKIFQPRPEAQAATWDQLMPPVKIAVHDLLVRIYGAHHGVHNKNTDKSADNLIQQTGNCFLVYGLRGTGKTTVLLNAQRAVCQKSGKTFFTIKAEKSGKAGKVAETTESKARKAAENLREDKVVWLEILNLEPIPSEANLLTVLLTQVRNALHTHSDKRKLDQRSIFEEEANSAQQLLNKLINDTTLMWQNITEPDTRNISARQVKAADIHAGFQEKFNKAMDKLVEELSDTRGSDSKVSIVLPIDNIDRSTEHLQSIVKLAQLVSHPNLWLVMSGDRFEVTTFLERAYWKELIRSTDSAGARGKIDSDGEDEALVMARRQANATAQKLWPANHRVEINFLTPKETLDFGYKQNPTDTSESILELLENIGIPTTMEQRVKQEKNNMNLLDLFYVEEQVTGNLFYVEEPVTGKVKRKIESKYLTRAAQHGLSLPARSVLDLWQLLDWLVNDSSGGLDFRAEKIARTMLRNAISSSAMTNGMAQDLQNHILRRGEEGGTVLYFEFSNSKTKLNVIPMTSPNRDFEHLLKPVFIPKELALQRSIRSQLVVVNIEDIVLSIQYSYSPIQQLDSTNNKYPQPFVIESASDNEKMQIELPLIVTAWLVVLYDILVLAEATASSWVKGGGYDKNYPNVSVNHSVIQSGKCINIEPLFWTPPVWDVFLGRNIFSLRWKSIREEILKVTPQHQDSITKLLAACWIFCVLKTSVQLICSIDARFNSKIVDYSGSLENFREFNLPNLPQFVSPKSENEANNFEEEVMQAAGVFYQLIQCYKYYQLIQEQKNNKINKIIPAAYEILLSTGKWLETEFIYFLSYAFVPIESRASIKRFNDIWKWLSEKKYNEDKEIPTLTDYWQKNQPFILAKLEKKFACVEDADNGDTETTIETTMGKDENTGRETIIKTTKKSTKKTIEPLSTILCADLHKI